MPDSSPEDSGTSEHAETPQRSSASARLTTGVRLATMTAAAAWISYASTSLIGLHEGFWAAISSIVVMQSDLTGTEKSAYERFIGTAIGAVLGWVCANGWHQHQWIYALAIALSVFICWVAGIGTAGRLAAVTVTVIVLIPLAEPIWKIALYRFLEVSWGIAVAVAIQLTVSRLSRGGGSAGPT